MHERAVLAERSAQVSQSVRVLLVLATGGLFKTTCKVEDRGVSRNATGEGVQTAKRNSEANASDDSDSERADGTENTKDNDEKTNNKINKNRINNSN